MNFEAISAYDLIIELIDDSDGTRRTVSKTVRITIDDVAETLNVQNASGSGREARFSGESGTLAVSFDAVSTAPVRDVLADLDGDGVFAPIPWTVFSAVDGVVRYHWYSDVAHLLGDTPDEDNKWTYADAPFKYTEDGQQLLIDSRTVEDGFYHAVIRVQTWDGQTVDRDIEIPVRDMSPLVWVTRTRTSGHLYEVTVGGDPYGPDQVAELRIDWGDGSSTVVAGATATFTHEYELAGEYYIQIFATDEDATGYLGYYHVHNDEAPVIEGGFVSDGADGSITLQIDPDAAAGRTIAEIAWDLDGDGEFDDAAGAAATPQLLVEYDGGPLLFRATVRVTDSSGVVAYAQFEFTGEPGFVEPIPIDQERHVAGEQTQGFDVDGMLEIVRTLRPDVYSWWMRAEGVILQSNTQGGWFGWMTWDVLTYYSDKAHPEAGIEGGHSRRYIRMHEGFSELEAAQQMISAAETGQFASEFLAYKANYDFNHLNKPDGFIAWQDWYVQQAAYHGHAGYQAVSAWYSFQIVGAEFGFFRELRGYRPV